MQLDLEFARGPDGRTELARRRVSYPWALTRPFYLDDAPADMATVVPQSSAGGLYAGDRIVQQVQVAAGATAHVTTQGATVANAGRDGRHTENTWQLAVAADGWLEVMNDPVVLFPDSDLRQRVAIDAAGICVYSESIGWHPEPIFRRYQTEITVHRAGQLLALERVDIAATDIIRETAAAPDPLGGVGLMLFLNVDAEAVAQALRPHVAEDRIGIGILPNDAGLAVRIAAPTLGAVPKLQQQLWAAFRTFITGINPASRRKGA